MLFIRISFIRENSMINPPTIEQVFIAFSNEAFNISPKLFFVFVLLGSSFIKMSFLYGIKKDISIHDK